MKKIGIVGWKTGENSFGVTTPYLSYLSKFGQVEILTPRKGIVKDLDLLVLPGGADLNPNSYGEVPGFHTSNPDVMKQFFYENNLEQYVRNNTPIFGICLGFQQLSSYFGCKITQDMYHPTSTRSRSELVHSVIICDGVGISNEGLVTPNLVKSAIKGKSYKEKKVNSLHHQAVHIDNFNHENLLLTLIDDLGVYVEGWVHKELRIAGVQYHPEEINDTYSSRIIKEFLS